MHSDRKHILLISNIFLPAIGGPAVLVDRLARALSGKGHEVTVLCATSGKLPEGAAYKVVRCGLHGNRIQREVSIRAHLLQAVFKADHVYILGLEHQAVQICRMLRRPYTIRFGGDIAWETARNAGKTVLTPEEFYHAAEDQAYVSTELRRRKTWISHASQIVLLNNYMKQLFSAWGHDKNDPRVRIIANGIPPECQGHAVQKRDSEFLRLIYVGRLTNWKGVDLVLLALKALDDRNVVLTIVGDGPQRPMLHDLALRLGIMDQVTFTGIKHGADLRALMTSHDVLVLTSIFEGMSNTLLEAGGAGLAVITSTQGGNAELVKNMTSGLVVDPFKVAALENAIRALRDDENLRRRLAEAHQANVAKDFTLDQTVAATEQLFI
jgi:glycosyltransferase involved in cell wall biosynthesis